MTGQPRSTGKLVLRVFSCLASIYVAVIIFAVSLASYAGAFSEWFSGNPYGRPMLLALFLSVSAIGMVTVQISAKQATKKALIVRFLCGGMGTVTSLFFTMGWFNQLISEPYAYMLIHTICATVATLTTGLRSYSAITMALMPDSRSQAPIN